jgi:hypothetical protein
MDPHYFWWLTPDSDPHWSEKLDRIRIKVKLQKLSRLKKTWREVDANKETLRLKI